MLEVMREHNRFGENRFMDLNNLTVFSLANQDMKYLTERQKILAGNVANANTPGYLAQDLKKPSFSDELNSTLQMSVTNEKHFTGRGGSSLAGRIYTPKPTQPLTIDGNGVVLEDQLNEISKDKGEYGRVLALYNSYKNMLKTAVTKISS